ncbi:MAG: [NiFe]-hydrogenase assembly chaperone HybE, partial [Rhodobiaceae bacterium]|nr:[NiFe]-hydrogenase assembly chaperone HybE [Rhodobiaceae bacterium]
MAELADIGPGLEACFEDIRSSRMAGIPILNDALSVKAIGVRSWNGFRLCVLITPWFMNLMALPDAPEDEPVVSGTKRMFAFPAGTFEFIAGREKAIGEFWMCSLFSPVLVFSVLLTA